MVTKMMQMPANRMIPNLQRPMYGGLGGLSGGLDDRVFAPLKNMLGQHLTQSVVEEKVEPFVEEVKTMAQERFDLGNNFSPRSPQLGAMNPVQQLGSLDQMCPANFDPSQEVQYLSDLKSKFADGGPVSAGLGSFLTSNLDEFGRNGDTEMIHATREEVIMPKGMMDDPRIRETVREAFDRTGRDMAEYTVGSGQMNVNPMTGYEEAFDLIKGIKDLFKKAAPILLPAAVSVLFPGMSPFLSGAITGGVGSLLQGGDAKDAFKAALMGGTVSGSVSALQTGRFFQGDPNFQPLQMRGGQASVETGAGGKVGQALADPKSFFMNPKLTADQVAQAQGYDSLASAPKNVQPSLTQAALNSGGINTGRAIAAGLGGLALAGGFDEIEEDPPEDPYPYSSRELMEMYPDRYTTGPIIAPSRRRNDEVITFAAKGGEMEFPRRQGYIAGPGTETSDDIPAMLSDGEFVMTARAVRGAGDGSRKKGVEKMYDIMRAFEGGVVS